MLYIFGNFPPLWNLNCYIKSQNVGNPTNKHCNNISYFVLFWFYFVIIYYYYSHIDILITKCWPNYAALQTRTANLDFYFYFHFFFYQKNHNYFFSPIHAALLHISKTGPWDKPFCSKDLDMMKYSMQHLLIDEGMTKYDIKIFNQHFAEL